MRFNLFYILFIFSSTVTFGQQVDLVTPLDTVLFETSGLILLDDRLITHNDSGGETALFEIDTLSGGVARKVIIDNASNVDWEDICYDDTYIYVGDFGNNAGTRTNLRVYRVLISDYLNTPNDTISADTIHFNYADQTDFTSAVFSTNYDAEGLVAWNDSLYIFTKNWGNMWTNVYALPTTPGTYAIQRVDSVNVEGFITGASFNDSSNSIILSGHTITYPIVVEISNFSNSQFSSATVERTQIQFPAGYSYQFEGIAPINANNFYLSTEQSTSGSTGVFRLDLTPTNALFDLEQSTISIHPNPVSEVLHVDFKEAKTLEIFSSTGKFIRSTTNTEINVSTLPSGTYLLTLKDKSGNILGRERVVII